jgi:hypothetical protein
MHLSSFNIKGMTMSKETVFAKLIKDLSPFDRRLVLALHALRSTAGSLEVHTSRFALLGALRLDYSDVNVKRLNEALYRLAEKPLFLLGPESGFAFATKAITQVKGEKDSEQLVISLGNLFLL